MQTFSFKSYDSAMGEVDDDIHVFESLCDLMREAEESVSPQKCDDSYSDEFGTCSVIYDEIEFDSYQFKIIVSDLQGYTIDIVIQHIVSCYDVFEDAEYFPKIELYEGVCYLVWEYKCVGSF